MSRLPVFQGSTTPTVKIFLNFTVSLCWKEYEGQRQFRLNGYNLQSVLQYINGIFTFLFLSRFNIIQYEGTLFSSDTEHLALIRILAIPACPYRAAVCSGVSPY